MSRHQFKTFPNQNHQEQIVSALGLNFLNASGEKYVDLTSGLTGHAVLGWGDKDIIDSIYTQLNTIGHSDCKVFADNKREEFCELFINSCENDLNRVFFSGGSGAEACESAIHISYQVHCENGKNAKNHYISRNQSYHGATTETMSLGDRPNLDFLNHYFRQIVQKYQNITNLGNQTLNKVMKTMKTNLLQN